MEEVRKAILAGNPNTGKTTLFNTLANASEHAGNWHGVTVGVKEKDFKINQETFTLCDLPGLYSLDGFSKEEQIASEFIESNKDAVVVCIVDANNLRRNLFLALELIDRTNNVVIAVNMAKEASLNYEALSRELGVKVVPIDARTKKGVKALKDVIFDLAKSYKKSELNAIPATPRVSIKEFEKNAKEVFDKIDKMLLKAKYEPKANYRLQKMDKVLLNGVFSAISFIFVMALVFFITFGAVGSFLSSVFSGVFEYLSDLLMGVLNRHIQSEALLRFIEEGVLGGVLAVLSFLPQVLLMFICLNLLEDIGYLSRVAVMLDPLFKKIGLTGRSAFSLIMGFGCTTTAIITTRNLDNKKLREKTTLLLPFMSCSAKLPIYAVICSAFFTKYKALMVFLLYFIGVGIMFLVAAVIKKHAKESKEELFMLELPKYRFPRFSKIFKDALENAKSFVVRVGGVLMVSSIVVFLLFNFSFGLKYVGGGDGVSILESVAGKLTFIFKPLGFGCVGAVVAIISGLVAKEMVVSSLAITSGVSVSMLAESLASASSPVHFTTASAFSFLVFVLLYSPCLSAGFAMKKEAGGKVALTSCLLQMGIAYVTSLITYLLGYLIQQRLYVIFALALVLIAILITAMLKWKRKKNIRVAKVHLCVNCREKTCHDRNSLRGRGERACQDTC